MTANLNRRNKRPTVRGAAEPLSSSAPVPLNRPPTREEIEALVSEKQIELAELKRAQEELERERADWRNCAGVKSNFKPDARR